MSTNTVDPAQPTASTVVVATDGSVTVTQVSNATTVTYPGVLSTPFSPLDLSPTLWLDASDETTITESGGAVSQWDDKSGNGYNVTQGTAAAQPTTGTRTINSLNVLDFDGSKWLLSSSSLGLSNTTNFNVFAVAVLDVADSFSTIFGTGTFGSVGRAAAFQVSSVSGVSRQMATDVWKPRGMVADTSIDLATEYLFTYQVYPWSDVVTASTFRLNGVDDGATAYGGAITISLGSGVAAVGAFGAALTSSRWDGAIAELIVVDGTLTAQQVSHTETYLADKWGITL